MSPVVLTLLPFLAPAVGLWQFGGGPGTINAGGLGAQPLDATLTALATLGTGADRGVYFTGVDAAAEFTLTAAGRALVDDANASAQRTTLGVAIGSDVQAYDSALQSIASAGVPGTNDLTWTVNDDAVGGGNEDAAIILESSDAAGQTNSVFTGTVTLNAGTMGDAFYEMALAQAGSPISVSLNLGVVGQVAAQAHKIVFNSGNGAVTRTGQLEIDGTNDRITLRKNGTGAARLIGADDATIDAQFGTLALQVGSTNAIAIDSTGDTLVSRTGGSSGDPDFEVDGYAKFDGTTELGALVSTGGRVDKHTEINSASSPYTVLATDHVILCDPSAGNVTINMPAASAGRVYEIAKVDSGGNTCTVDGNGAETINGAATYVLDVAYEAGTFRSRASTWQVF